ncbi:MAG: cadherin-like domain-containing protein [Solirubrobacterales bacterium]|nr:cadherin-like domain-containing protein [Solirubrobacterales bacterium]
MVLNASNVFLQDTLGGQTATTNGETRLHLAMVIQHDIGRSISGIRIDDDWNGTEQSASKTLRPVSTQTQTTIHGGYAYTRLEYAYDIPVFGGWDCSLFGSKTNDQTKPISLLAELDNGERTTPISKTLNFNRQNNCSYTNAARTVIRDQSQSDTEVAPGESVTFNYTGKQANTTLSGGFAGIKWRLRRLSDGYTTAPEKSCNSTQTTITFPQRGLWAVEATGLSNELVNINGDCYNDGRSNQYMYLGLVDVNSNDTSSPTGNLTATRPVLGGSSTINVAGATDTSDSANGGLVEDIEWDLDFNGANGRDGFEEHVFGTWNGGLPGGSTTRTVNTSSLSPGWYSVRSRLTDNGAFSAADLSRKQSTLTTDFLVDSLPVASPASSQVESDQTVGVNMNATDSDVFPAKGIDDNQTLSYSILAQPANGSATAPSGNTTTYNPDDDFSGYDTFTFGVNDGWGGTDSETATVRVDPQTYYTDVPSTTVDHNDRSAAPEFTSPTEGSTLTRYECSLDYTAWYVCDSGDEIQDLDDGLHNLRVRAHGGDNTFDPTPAETEWVVDAKPAVTFTGTPNPDSGDTSPDFTFDVDESGNTAPFQVECRITGPDQSGEWAPCASPLHLSDLADGQYELTVRATDQHGRIGTSSYAWEVAADGVHTWIDQKPAAFAADASAEFTFDTDDPTSTFECSFDGAAWDACTSPVDLSGLADGPHTFQVRAVNTAGTADATPAAWHFVVDTIAPDTTVTGNVPARTNQPLALTFSSNEDEVTFQCQVDGGSWAACDSPYTGAALTDGPHTLLVAAVDRAGNVDASPESRSWILDTVAPTSEITEGPADGSLLNSSSADFEFDADESSSFQCKMDSQSWRNCDGVSTQSYAGLPDGERTFRVRAVDQAGNVENPGQVRTWSIDTAAPVVGIDDGPTGTSRSDSATFKFGSSESGVSFECRLDDGGYSACDSPETVNALADGSHTFRVRARDDAGNYSEHPAARTWAVDTSTLGPPDPEEPEKPEPACTFKSTAAKCSSPILTGGLKKIGKKIGKNSALQATLNTGRTSISSAKFRLGARTSLKLSKKARGRALVTATVKTADGNKTVRLKASKKLKPGARGVVTLSGGGLTAKLARGWAPSVDFQTLPTGTVKVAIKLKGAGVTLRTKSCATQKLTGTAVDTDSNRTSTSAFIDPPCRAKKKGAR